MKKYIIIYSPAGQELFQFTVGQKADKSGEITGISTVTGCTGYAVDIHWSNGVTESYMGFPFVLVEQK